MSGSTIDELQQRVWDLRTKFQSYDGGDRPMSPPVELMRELADAERLLRDAKNVANGSPLFYCSGDSCPGLPYRASDIYHPASCAKPRGDASISVPLPPPNRTATIALAVHLGARIAEDGDLHFLCGPSTETGRLLCAAAAELTGRTIEDIEATMRGIVPRQKRTLFSCAADSAVEERAAGNFRERTLCACCGHLFKMSHFCRRIPGQMQCGCERHILRQSCGRRRREPWATIAGRRASTAITC